MSASPTPAAGAQRNGVHGFDFLMGDWRVHHTYKPRGGSEWMEFDGTCNDRPLAGGAANVEEHVFARPTGVTYGIATRAYDAKSGQWAIWWIDSRDPHLPMDPPMKGGFGEDGVGYFYSDFVDQGKPMRARFIWSQITPVSARWEQAFSADAGKTWDTNWIMEFRRSNSDICCSVFELRQYTLKPQQREVLIELFEREFIETQEAEGMRLFGQFRDLDDPDRLVWIRAFADMPTREHALTAFYTGPAWKQHGREAAATMIDADNVLLLRPVHQTSVFPLDDAARAPVGAATPTSSVSATVYHLEPAAAADFPQFFRDAIRPALQGAGIEPMATFATEASPNTYPRLPVREGEQVFVWLARFDSVESHARAFQRLTQSPSWTAVEATLAKHLKSPTQQLRLQPTARSLLR